MIIGLHVDGLWFIDAGTLKREVMPVFMTLFQSNVLCSLQSHQDLHYYSLFLHLSMEEVNGSLVSMDSFKAPVLMDFSPSLADTLLFDLNPKVDVPNSLKEFWPISMFYVFLKLISKVLVRT